MLGGSSNSSAKVLLIAPQPFFANRGTPINVRALAETLGDRGLKVDLLVYPFGSDLIIPNVNIIRSARVPGINSVPIGPSWTKAVLDIFILTKAVSLIRKNRYAVIHGIEEAAIIGYLLSRFFKVPYIFDMDSHIVDQLQTSGFITVSPLLRICSALEELALKNSTAVLTVCSELTNVARRIAKNVPIFQIEDFANQDQLRVIPSTLQKIQGQMIKPGEKVVVYTGNFETYQGIDLLLESFTQALSKVNARLLLVGGKPSDIEKYRLKAKDLKISDKVTFAGECPGEEIGTYLSVADVLVSPRNVGCNTPLKVYSYMAVGKPIVATRILSHTQVMDDKVAFLTDVNPESFAEGLIKALSDEPSAKADRELRSQKASELARSRYSREHFDAELNRLYDFILQNKPHHSSKAVGL